MGNTDVVARGADVPLALSQAGPRDALLDPRPTDIIPDLENKGLHVGEVAQPAEAVLHRSGDVTFESLSEAPDSRFPKETSFAEQKRRNSEFQASRPEYAGREFVGDGLTPEAATYRDPAPRATNDGEGTRTKADLRARLTELGVAEDDQPGSRATVADLEDAVTQAESSSAPDGSQG